MFLSVIQFPHLSGIVVPGAMWPYTPGKGKYGCYLHNKWKGAKRKGTHTVSLQREKSIYVSSAINAYQAIDILLKNLKKEKAADKIESNEGYYLAGGLSLNTSGITVRDIESVVTWRWDYGIEKGLFDIIIQKLFSGRKKNVYGSNLQNERFLFWKNAGS